MTSKWSSSAKASKCDAAENNHRQKFGMFAEESGDFRNLFPKRQLWQPSSPYPLWDKDWDSRNPTPSGDDDVDRRKMRKLRKEGVTRHVILVRHGQYDETEQDDAKRILTETGRKQADYTGKRLKEMLDGANAKYGACNIKVVRVSNMARAKESKTFSLHITFLFVLSWYSFSIQHLIFAYYFDLSAADIIASHLPNVERALPDTDLNEGRPAHNIPGGKASASTIRKTDETHPRIEKAFQKYFFRAEPPKEIDDDSNAEKTPNHEFEIIVWCVHIL
jgi:serine/threonine-protein phosphatase PGAM5